MKSSESKQENLKDIYNRLAKNWGWSESSWGYDGIKRFTKRVKKGKVLDLGCGSGFQSKFLVESGLEVVGIDFSEKMIEECRKRVLEASFLVMDMLDLDFPNEDFDGVYARASLLHLKKSAIASTLQRVNRLVKKGSVFYIAVKEGNGENYVDHPEKGTRFFAFYQENELKGYLGKAGFKIEDVFYESLVNTNWLQIIAIKT